MSDHFIEQCSCGKVLSQCRCGSEHKTIVIKHDACAECQGKVKAVVAKMTHLEMDTERKPVTVLSSRRQG